MDAKEQKSSIKKFWLLYGTPFVLALIVFCCFVYVSNINLWWGEVEKFSIRQFASPIKCEKKFWTGFGNITLLNCKTGNNTFALQELGFNLFKSKLYLRKPFIKLQQSKKTKGIKFPDIPNFINTIVVKDLLIKDYFPEATSAFVELNEIDSLELKRSAFFVNQWKIKAHADHKVLLIEGLLGNKIDLKIIANNLKIRLPSVSDFSGQKQLFVNGAVDLKCRYLGKTQLKAAFNNLLLNLELSDLKSNKELAECGKLLLNGSINLGNDFSNILDFEQFKISSSFLSLNSGSSSSRSLSLENTRLSKLCTCASKLSRVFSAVPFSISSNSSSLLRGSLEFPEDKINNLLVTLELPEAFNIVFQQKSKYYSIDLAQFKLIARPLKNLSSKAIANPLQRFGLQTFKLIISDFDFSSLQGLAKGKDLKAIKGHLNGDLSYSSPLDLAASFNLYGLEAALGKPSVKLKDGKGQIKVKGQDILLNLESLVSLNQKGSYDKVFSSGRLVWLWDGLVNGQVGFSAKKLSVAQENPFKSVSLLDGYLNNSKALLKINKSKISSLRAEGQLTNFFANIDTLKNPIHLKQGSYLLNFIPPSLGELTLEGLNINYNNSKAFISTTIPLDKKQNFQPRNLRLKGEILFDDIKQLLINSKAAQKNIQDLKNYEVLGSLDYDIEYKGQQFTKLELEPKNFVVNYKGKPLFDEFKGNLGLDKRGNLVFKNLQLRIGEKSKFALEAQLPPIQKLMAINSSTQLNNLVQSLEIRVRGMINPHDLVENLVQRKIIEKPKVEFDEQISLPLFARAFPRGDSLRFNFGTNFYKLQITNSKVFLSQDLSNVEEIFGNGEVDFRSKTVSVSELNYRGKNFGILGSLNVKPQSWSFNLESAPLIDLEELSKIWFNENASGQFKGKLASTDFDPKVKNSWLNNLHVDFRSEENVHDIQYGILYGKHFSLGVDTKNGSGNLDLHTRKGKIKNLQITNLFSRARIEDKERLTIDKVSLSAADGTIDLNGNIDLSTWESFFTGSMNGVNIETVSNNLFNNKGDYNGKGKLEYNFKGNFKELLTSKPPEDAYGRFAIQSGSLSQAAELSKNLHLVNLIFSGPFRLGGFFSSLERYRNSSKEGNFKLIDGDWNFDSDKKLIRLEEANYVGTNALHMRLFGDWDYKSSMVDFSVFGFIPKTPKYIGESIEAVERFKELESEKILKELLLTSRHFKFAVKGSSKDANQLKNSVKNTIKFLDTSLQSDVSKAFLENFVAGKK